MAKTTKTPPTPVKAVKAPTGFSSPFDAGELAKWRQLLIQRRGEISGDIEGLVKDAMEAEDGHTTPNHIAERGSDADLQDLSLGVAGDEKELLWQIDRALRKIDRADPMPFGLCEFTKQPIPKTRLQLIPWTPLSIEGAERMEREGLTLEDMLEDG
jgi:RNA polymerase-binding transcription factor DksA